MSAIEAARWHQEGRKAFAAGLKCYGAESMSPPKKSYRTAWRNGWREAMREASRAESAA